MNFKLRIAMATVLVGFFVLAAAPGSRTVRDRGASAADQGDQDNSVSVESPGGAVHVEFGLYEQSGQSAVPCYKVSFRGKPLIRQASLGIDLASGGPLGSNLKIRRGLVDVWTCSFEPTTTGRPSGTDFRSNPA